MDRSWILKALHRLIVGSATYRQGSRVRPGLLARDPYNRLLARGPRIRTTAMWSQPGGARLRNTAVPPDPNGNTAPVASIG